MDITQIYLFLVSILLNVGFAQDMSRWDSWWSYEGLSGPGFWGLLNMDWMLCNRGKNQSPININPKTLLFDPSLGPIVIEGNRLTGHLHNNGHDITFKVSNTTLVNITEGPLSYRYRIAQIRIHFHLEDHLGSEHTIDGKSFPAEIQIIGYNVDLYNNITIAQRSPRGLTIIALFAQIADLPHSEFGVILKAIKKTKYKGDKTRIRGLELSRLLPAIDHYVTYEGSTTHPGCYETVSWLVLNKPIHISRDQLDTLRILNQATIENPRMLMAPNIRPEMEVNQRTVRTNINFVCPACEASRVGQMIRTAGPRSRSCSMGKEMFYKGGLQCLCMPYHNWCYLFLDQRYGYLFKFKMFYCCYSNFCCYTRHHQPYCCSNCPHIYGVYPSVIRCVVYCEPNVNINLLITTMDVPMRLKPYRNGNKTNWSRSMESSLVVLDLTTTWTQDMSTWSWNHISDEELERCL